MGKRKITKPITMTTCSCGHPLPVSDNEKFKKHLETCPLSKNRKAYRKLVKK